MASQSGALGLAAIDQAAGRGLGLASFVSVGNKADVSSNDLLDYWADDPSVSVIALYLESFGNPRKFARVARRVARTKPIVAVKNDGEFSSRPLAVPLPDTFGKDPGMTAANYLFSRRCYP